MQARKTVRVVALLEAAKGILVLLTGVGALSLIHHDVQQVAEHLVEHMHLNPAKHYPQIFIDAAAHVSDSRLWTLAGLAALYSMVRLVEAYGLWRGRRWAEWFATVSGCFYFPFEIFELLEGKHFWISLATFAVNLLVVMLMIMALLRKDSLNNAPSHY